MIKKTLKEELKALKAKLSDQKKMYATLKTRYDTVKGKVNTYAYKASLAERKLWKKKRSAKGLWYLYKTLEEKIMMARRYGKEYVSFNLMDAERIKCMAQGMSGYIFREVDKMMEECKKKEEKNDKRI